MIGEAETIFCEEADGENHGKTTNEAERKAAVRYERIHKSKNDTVGDEDVGNTMEETIGGADDGADFGVIFLGKRFIETGHDDAVEAAFKESDVVKKLVKRGD